MYMTAKLMLIAIPEPVTKLKFNFVSYVRISEYATGA